MASEALATVVKMIESLPESVQDRVVERLRDHIEDAREEMQWDESFSRSQVALAAAARKARAEVTQGLAVPLNDPDMLEEYDFSKGVRGKYAKRYSAGANVVVIDPDVAEYFPDHESVNESLRGLVSIIKRRQEVSSPVASKKKKPRRASS